MVMSWNTAYIMQMCLLLLGLCSVISSSAIVPSRRKRNARTDKIDQTVGPTAIVEGLLLPDDDINSLRLVEEGLPNQLLVTKREPQVLPSLSAGSIFWLPKQVTGAQEYNMPEHKILRLNFLRDDIYIGGRPEFSKGHRWCSNPYECEDGRMCSADQCSSPSRCCRVVTGICCGDGTKERQILETGESTRITYPSRQFKEEQVDTLYATNLFMCLISHLPASSLLNESFSVVSPTFISLLTCPSSRCKTVTQICVTVLQRDEGQVSRLMKSMLAEEFPYKQGNYYDVDANAFVHTPSGRRSYNTIPSIDSDSDYNDNPYIPLTSRTSGYIQSPFDTSLHNKFQGYIPSPFSPEYNEVFNGYAASPRRQTSNSGIYRYKAKPSYVTYLTGGDLGDNGSPYLRPFAEGSFTYNAYKHYEDKPTTPFTYFGTSKVDAFHNTFDNLARATSYSKYRNEYAIGDSSLAVPSYSVYNGPFDHYGFSQGTEDSEDGSDVREKNEALFATPHTDYWKIP